MGAVEAGARVRGTGPPEAGAPGFRDEAARSWRRGSGAGRPEAGTRGSGTRPAPSWRPGRGPGRLVHGPGRLWPWPRRPGPWGVEEGSRERGGSAEGASPKGDLVTKTQGRSLFLASSVDVTKT